LPRKEEGREGGVGHSLNIEGAESWQEKRGSRPCQSYTLGRGERGGKFLSRRSAGSETDAASQHLRFSLIIQKEERELLQNDFTSCWGEGEGEGSSVGINLSRGRKGGGERGKKGSARLWRSRLERKEGEGKAGSRSIARGRRGKKGHKLTAVNKIGERTPQGKRERPDLRPQTDCGAAKSGKGKKKKDDNRCNCRKRVKSVRRIQVRDKYNQGEHGEKRRVARGAEGRVKARKGGNWR